MDKFPQDPEPVTDPELLKAAGDYVNSVWRTDCGLTLWLAYFAQRWAAHLRQQQREQDAQTAHAYALNCFDPPDEELADAIAAAIRSQE